MTTTTITTPPSPGATGTPANAYQRGRATSDRSVRCPNRNGIWPPIYKRHWKPLPRRSLSNIAQAEWQRCVQDAVAAGELHRTTGAVLLRFSRHSDNRLADVWPAQATVARDLHLAESTVCHHIAKAKAAGWVEVQHRNRFDRGQVVAMTNITRLHLPEQWQQHLNEARRRRQAHQQAARTARPGRVTPSKVSPPRAGQGEDRRPVTWTPAMHAAAAGAAQARISPDFETGRRELAEQYTGKPALYEAAYDEYAATWASARRNE